MALYHKYRPQSFADLAGQDHIRKILQEALALGRTTHGYLFTGPRGLGKTTTARLLAKALNCIVNRPTATKPVTSNVNRQSAESRKTKAETGLVSDNRMTLICNRCQFCQDIQAGRSLDVIEIDAASNRGIDEIRELREKIKFAPTAARFKIFIIDEVHMLTKEAFNALLKTLEEPPAHALFILATTEPHKVPATIVSRVQRFDFKRPSVDTIARYLATVANQEKIAIAPDAITELARLADGSFRDAITLLDQLSTTGETISSDHISAMLGLPTGEKMAQLETAFDERDGAAALQLVDEFYRSGIDFGFLYKQLIAKLRDTMITRVKPDLAGLITRLLTAQEQAKLAPLPQIPLEIVIMEYCAPQSGDVKTQNSRLPKLLKAGGQAKLKTPESKDFDQKWAEIIEAIRPFNHSLAGILQEGRVVGFDGETIQVAVKFAFYKDRILESKNHQKIHEAIHKVMGSSTRLVCQVDHSVSSPFENDGLLIEEAQELFGVSPESTD